MKPYQKNLLFFFAFFFACLSSLPLLSAAPDGDSIKDGVYIWTNKDTGQRMGITVKTVGGSQTYSFMTEVYGADNWSPMVRKPELDGEGYVVITVESERLIEMFTFYIKHPQEKADEIQVSIYTDRNTYLPFKRQN
ncbi:hypothetical protein [Hugenholtzia roseola]|uniref:hypothetical protein n=1 Tax=Hugenholtzia roseola TaxID=1002 RepID=UPI00040BEBDE|nr:hypothetical protein [Hugenholtzia roseola]